MSKLTWRRYPGGDAKGLSVPAMRGELDDSQLDAITGGTSADAQIFGVIQSAFSEVQKTFSQALQNAAKG